MACDDDCDDDRRSLPFRCDDCDYRDDVPRRPSDRDDRDYVAMTQPAVPTVAVAVVTTTNPALRRRQEDCDYDECRARPSPRTLKLSEIKSHAAKHVADLMSAPRRYVFSRMCPKQLLHSYEAHWASCDNSSIED